MKFSSYIIGIIVIIILSTFSEVLLTKNRIGKFINYVFSSLIILMVITPVSQIVSNGFSFNENIFNYEITLDNEFLSYIEEFKNGQINLKIEEMLAQNGYKNARVKVSMDVETQLVQTIKVNLSNLVIDAEIEHINKYERITSLICEYLDVTMEAVEYE